MTNNNFNKKAVLKRIIVAVIAVFLLLIVVLGVLALLSVIIKRDKVDFTDKDESIYYFSADYSADLDKDLIYSAKDTDVFFTDHTGFGEYLTEADSDINSTRGLLYRYFQSLKNGDGAAHAALLSGEYKKNFVVQTRFTPQKVYDIKVDFLTGDSINGKYVEKYNVTYKIYKNDGTYRADIPSDVAKTMVFEVVNEDNCYYINSIVANISKGE